MRRALLLFCLVAAACSRSDAVREGAKVALDFTLSVDGKVVDATSRGETLRFRVGSGEVLAGLEEKLAGLKAGEERLIVLPPEKGYGLVDPARVQKLPLSAFKGLNAPLKPGLSVSGLSQGRAATGKVVAVSKTEATLDFNHPLAGKTLEFRVKVLSVE